MDPTRLALSITHADGRVSRWGPDETDAKDIPQALQFGTSVPAGFKDAQLNLLRRIGVDYPDLALFDDVRVYGPGDETAWEGRMAQLPRSHGAGFGITPGAVGWSAHLRDDPSFVEVYVDRELGRWGAIPLNEQIRLSSASDFRTLSYANEGGGLVCALPSQAVGAAVDTQAWYAAPLGAAIKFVYYRGIRVGWPGAWNAALLRFHPQDSFSGSSQTVAPTMDDTIRLATATTARRYVSVEVFTGAAATPVAGAHERWATLAAIGDHGVTPRAISGEPDGFYLSDLIANIVSRAAPKLTTGGIEPHTFIVPHAVFAEPVTAEQAILALTAYSQAEWGVWEDREFFYRQTDPDRLCWEARLSDGAHLSLEGDQAEDLVNGVFVTYTDPSGVRKTVGPPGASADATDAALADTSSSNPVNAHGITRRWAVLDVPLTTQAGAIEVGTYYLAEKLRASRRGTLAVSGMGITHPTLGPSPVWRMRAGDYVRVADHSGSVRRRIIETRYDHPSRSQVCALDNTSHTVAAILEAYGAVLVGRI